MFLIVSSLVVVTGCSNSNPSYPMDSAATPSPNTVTMGNSSFISKSMTVAKGTTITWSNTSGTTHTSTSDTGAWDTGDIPAGGSKTTTFNTVGTFGYHCKYHASMGMTGTITVH